MSSSSSSNTSACFTKSWAQIVSAGLESGVVSAITKPTIKIAEKEKGQIKMPMTITAEENEKSIKTNVENNSENRDEEAPKKGKEVGQKKHKEIISSVKVIDKLKDTKLEETYEENLELDDFYFYPEDLVGETAINCSWYLPRELDRLQSTHGVEIILPGKGESYITLRGPVSRVIAAKQDTIKNRPQMVVLAIEEDEIETVKALETENDVIILVCCYLKKFLIIGRKNGCNKALNAILSLPSKGIPSSNEKDPENDREYFDIFRMIEME